MRMSVCVSYAVSVLSLDLEVLQRSLEAPGLDILQTLVDELPLLLSRNWVGGGWSLAADATDSVVAAAELSLHESSGLLGMHAEIYQGDLSNAFFVTELKDRIDARRTLLWNCHTQLEERIREIQELVKAQYASGVASVNDWLA